MKQSHDTPPALYRISDGEPLSLNDDGTYSLDNSVMGSRCSWTYAHLMAYSPPCFTSDPNMCLKRVDE